MPYIDTPCKDMTQHFRILLDKINTSKVYKESVNKQTSNHSGLFNALTCKRQKTGSDVHASL